MKFDNFAEKFKLLLLLQFAVSDLELYQTAEAAAAAANSKFVVDDSSSIILKLLQRFKAVQALLLRVRVLNCILLFVRPSKFVCSKTKEMLLRSKFTLIPSFVRIERSLNCRLQKSQCEITLPINSQKWLGTPPVAKSEKFQELLRASARKSQSAFSFALLPSAVFALQLHCK